MLNNTIRKDVLLESLEQMPDRIVVEQLIDTIILWAKIEAGLKDVEEGRMVPHSEIVKMFDEWLK